METKSENLTNHVMGNIEYGILGVRRQINVECINIFQTSLLYMFGPVPCTLKIATS